MAEEAATQDVNSEINVDLFADEVEQTAPSEPKEATSTEEAKPQAEAEAEEPAEETETEGSDEKVEESESEEAPETEETETNQPKNRAQERIRTLANENRALRDQLAQVYRAPTAEEIAQAALEKGEDIDPAMAEIQAIRQEREVERYTNHVVNTTSAVEQSANDVLRDFPIFDPKSEQYDEGLATRAQEVYLQAAGIQTDQQTGLISNINVLPYDIFKAFAETQASSVQTGAVKGQKSAEKMIARTDAPSAAAPKPVKSDPLIELWKD